MLRNVLFISLEIVGAYGDILIGDGISTYKYQIHSMKMKARLSVALYSTSSSKIISGGESFPFKTT